MIRFSKSKEIVRNTNNGEVIDFHHKLMLDNVVCGSIVYNVTEYGVFIKDLHVFSKFRRKGAATQAIELLKNSFNDKLFIGGGSLVNNIDSLSFWKSVNAEVGPESFYIPTRTASSFI